MTDIKPKKTSRGFALITFADGNGERCSLQKSSAAEKDFIWLGLERPDLQETGWHPSFPARARPFTLPDHVLAFSRMHLTREQVSELLPFLTRFVETGEL